MERGTEERLDGLRQAALRRALALTALGMPAVCALIVVGELRRGTLTPVVLRLTVGSLLFPLLWWLQRRLPYRRVAVIYIGLIAVTAFTLQTRGGLTLSVAAVQLLLVLLSGLIFGRRGAVVGLFLALLGLALAGTLVATGAVPPIDPAFWNPADPFVWIRGAVVLATVGSAAVLGVVLMVEQLGLEAERLRVALDREVAERAAREAAEKDRERAERALMEAHRLEGLGRLAAGVAHDFNNTLTVILGTTELLLESTALDAESVEGLRDIQQASNRAANLTSELLALGRHGAIQVAPVNLLVWANSLKAPLRRVLPRDIELVVDAKPVWVEVSAVNLERVLVNLVVNARDAIVGAGRIEVSIRAVGDTALLSVKDTGTGMDAATLERAFEPFFTTKAVGKGTGLGLALARRFAEDSRGTIQVDSAVGVGTKVILQLPACEPVDDEGPADAQPLSTDELGRGKSVLLVEDEPLVRSTITRCLERSGFSVVTAPNGDVALEILQDLDVKLDVMCVDGVIPGASSGRVIDMARSLRPGIGVILCSGYLAEDLLRRGVRAGELAFLSKPFTSAELLGAVRAELLHAAGRARRSLHMSS